MIFYHRTRTDHRRKLLLWSWRSEPQKKKHQNGVDRALGGINTAADKISGPSHPRSTCDLPVCYINIFKISSAIS